jgi:ABC-type phosphate transport system substrate-binding protein
MQRIRLIVALLAAVFAGTTRLVAQERPYVVIVNESNNLTGLSTDELARLFMKKTVRWTTGQTVTPVDLAENSAARSSFSQDVHHKSTAEVKSYWQTVIFGGRGIPPMEAPSEVAVVQFVRANPGAIAYVSTSTPLGPGVRMVRVH